MSSPQVRKPADVDDSESNSRLRAKIGLLALCLCAGCAVDQAAEVATYRQVLDGAPAPARLEFEAHDDLTLDLAIQLANQRNELLVLSGEDYLQALINENRAVAGFLPTVSLSPSFAASHSTSLGTVTTQTLPLNGSINLFKGFRDVESIDSTTAVSEERRLQLLDQQATLMLNVAQSFYQVLKAEQSTEVLIASLKLQAERLRDIRARWKLGIVKPLDVAQTEADEAAAQVALVQARSDARTARATLAFLTGVPHIDGRLVDVLSTPEDIAPLDQLVPFAESKRQDLLASQFATVASRHDVEVAFGQHYPSINLSANYIIAQEPSFGQIWNLSLSALVPIFNAGLIHDDVRTAWSRYRQAVASEQQLVREVAEQVEIGYENVDTSRKKIAQLHVEVNAAQRAFDLSDRSYQLGGASNLDRLTAQNTLLTAQLQLTSEIFNLKVFYLDLLRVTGHFGREPGHQDLIDWPESGAPQ